MISKKCVGCQINMEYVDGAKYYRWCSDCKLCCDLIRNNSWTLHKSHPLEREFPNWYSEKEILKILKLVTFA